MSLEKKVKNLFEIKLCFFFDYLLVQIEFVNVMIDNNNLFKNKNMNYQRKTIINTYVNIDKVQLMVFRIH